MDAGEGAGVSGLEKEDQQSGGLSRGSLGDLNDSDLGEEGPSSSPQGLAISPPELPGARRGPVGGLRLHRQQGPIQPGSTPFGGWPALFSPRRAFLAVSIPAGYVASCCLADRAPLNC